VSDIEAAGSTWAVGSIDLAASTAGVALDTGPVEIEAQTLKVRGLASDPAAPFTVTGRLEEDGAVLELNADVVREPLHVSAELELADMPLGRYARLSGRSPVRIPHGVLRATLSVEYTPALARGAGRIAIDDAQIVRLADDEDFAVAWDGLGFDVRSAELPLGEETSASTQVELAGIHLTSPRISLTRRAEGLVLPSLADVPSHERADGAPRVAGAAKTNPDAATPDAPAEPGPSANAPTESGASDDAPTGAGAVDHAATEAARSHRTTIGADHADGAPSGADRSDDATTTTTTTGATLSGHTTSGAHPTDGAPTRADPSAGATSEARPSDSGTTGAGRAEGAPPGESDASEASPVVLVLDRLKIDSGELRIVDRAVKPVYRGEVRELFVDARGIELPAATVRKASVSLRAPGGAKVELDATSGGDADIQITALVDKLPLAQFNPYVRQAAGYTILDGEATLETRAVWRPESYEAESDLTLSDLDVGNDSGGTLFKDYVGISISTALALLRDVTGKIALGIPIQGTVADGTDVGIGSVGAQAILKATIGAVTSPLKMLGAITMVGGKIADVAPAPVNYRPGKAALAKEAAGQVEPLAGVLSASPNIRLELAGHAGRRDIRALKEAAVLAEMAGESGLLGGIRNLASGGTRGAIRAALEARARGDEGPLDPGDAAELDELVAEKQVSDDDLAALAGGRAEQLRAYLVDREGVPGEQLSIGPPQISRDQGTASVGLTLK